MSGVITSFNTLVNIYSCLDLVIKEGKRTSFKEKKFLIVFF